ncbi:MAG: adenylate/guanylate cyclase domain-containing protein [Nannocystis sp.]|nr:adenylate/guanylate cyclase domain-containing protein [Nannocystis sp.]
MRKSGRRAFDPTLTEPHLWNALSAGVLVEFDQRLGPARVAEAIEAAGLSREYLETPDRWASITFHARFADALAAVLGLPGPPPHEHPFWQHWRRASWRFADGSVGSAAWLQIWAMERPSVYFADLERLYASTNQISRGRLVDRGDGWSRIEVTESTAFETRPAACWSRYGHFEKIPEIWGMPMATIEHPRCRHRDPGQASCIYTVRYDEGAAPAPEAALARIAGLLRAQIAGIIAQQKAGFVEHRRALLAQRKTASYLPANALRALELDPERELALGGHRCDGAVLFADIVGFTSRFAEANAEAVVEHLNLYFEAMDAVIAAHGGIVDKRMGDGIMVVFVAVEAPRTLTELGAAAVRCGLAMQRALPACNAVIVAQGGEPVAIRVGVSSGSLIQGNLGSASRMEYTVIGEPVNLAARLQSAAAPGRVLTRAESLVGAPELAQAGTARQVMAKGIGEVWAVELDPGAIEAV